MSSAKMRVLKPKIDEINKKYPKQEDAMKKQQEVMGLYSQYGVSPMGGCLPMRFSSHSNGIVYVHCRVLSSCASKVSCGPMTCPRTMRSSISRSIFRSWQSPQPFLPADDSNEYPEHQIYDAAAGHWRATRKWQQ